MLPLAELPQTVTPGPLGAQRVELLELEGELHSLSTRSFSKARMPCFETV